MSLLFAGHNQFRTPMGKEFLFGIYVQFALKPLPSPSFEKIAPLSPFLSWGLGTTGEEWHSTYWMDG